MKKIIALGLVYLIVMVSFSFVVFSEDEVDTFVPRVVDFVVLGDEGRDYVLSTDVNVIISIEVVEENLVKEGVKADLSELSSEYGVIVADDCEDQGEDQWFCSWGGLKVSKLGRINVKFDVTDVSGNSIEGDDDGVDAVFNVIEVKEGDNWDVYADEIDEVNKNFLELGDLSVIVPLQIVSKSDTELISFDVSCELGSNVASYEKVVYLDLNGAYLDVILSGVNSQGEVTRISDDVRAREVSGNLNEVESLGERGGDVFRDTGSFLKIDDITGFFGKSVTGMVVGDEIIMKCKSVIGQQRVSGTDVIYFEPEEDEFEVLIDLRDSILPDAQDVTLEGLSSKPFGFLEGPYKMLKGIVDFATSICSFSTKIMEVLSLLAMIPVVGETVYPTWEKFEKIWAGKDGTGVGGLRYYCEYVTCSDCARSSRSSIFTGTVTGYVSLGPDSDAVPEYTGQPTQTDIADARTTKENDLSKGLGDFKGPILDPFKSIYGALSCKPVCVSGVVFFLEKWRAIAEGKKRCKQVALANGMGTHHCSEWMAGAVCQEITGELWEIGVGSKLRGMLFGYYNKIVGNKIQGWIKGLGPWKTLIDAYLILDDLGAIKKKSNEVSIGLAKPVSLEGGGVMENPNRYPEPEVRYD